MTDPLKTGPPTHGPASQSFRKSFGPGLIWAATSVGVSHLVQSTRAGAYAGFALGGVVVLALVLKYPFFEYGARYAAATGRSLVEGYRELGRWALWLFLFITVVTAIVAVSAVVMFTAYMTDFALGGGWPLPLTGAAVMAVCIGLLGVGRYRGLDLTIKVILVILVLSTLAAVAAVLPRADPSTLARSPAEVFGTVVPVAFLLALVGWMPSPIDVAVWSSLWTLAKDRTTGVRTSVEAARRDFLIGYVGTGVLALAFLTLGATVLHQADVALSDSGAVFATQFVDLYSQTLGSWSRPIVLVAAVATMFSTSLAVMDGFPRAIERTISNLRAHGNEEAPPAETVYWSSMVGQGLIALFVLLFFVGRLTTMVDFATTVAFLTAPVLGYMNLKVVTAPDVAPEHRPGSGLIALSWVGLTLLGGTGIAYLTSLL